MIKKLLLIFFCLFAFAGQALAANVQSYTLPNGLQLFVKVNKRAPVAVFQIWYKVGSAYELNGITGISHVLEHLMFTGTKKFPEGKLLNIVKQNGGEQNAMTTQDYTMYYQVLPAAKLALSFQLEADRMVNLQLNQKNLSKALAVVKEEKRLRIDNNPQAITFNRFNSLAFISNPYHHPTIGWLADLNTMNLLDVRTWYHDWYAPNNAIIVVAGDVKPAAVYQLAKKYFGPLKQRTIPRRVPAGTQQNFGKRELVLNLPGKLPFLIMGYNVPSYLTTDKKWQPYALYVAAAVLGGSDSSRLQSQLVRGQEIASAAVTDYSMAKLYSSEFLLFGVPAANHTIQQLQQAFLDQVKLLREEPISPEELQRVKAQVIASQVYKQDSLFNQADEIGRLEVIGLPWQLNETFAAKIKAVTAAQVQAVAKQYFIPANLTVAEMNPV